MAKRYTVSTPASASGLAPIAATGPTELRALANWRKAYHQAQGAGCSRLSPISKFAHLQEFARDVFDIEAKLEVSEVPELRNFCRGMFVRTPTGFFRSPHGLLSANILFDYSE